MGFFEGIDIIKSMAGNLPESPGVYRMLGANDDVLYVGKAKALKRRVTSYTQPERLPSRLKRMVSETLRMEIIHTHTEVEALLLEANLIKKLRPRYNILLKDDKSFPYIHITGGHDFPRIEKYRGAQKAGGDYFGPFASVISVNDTIATLQKAFQLRNCSDSIFSSRTRPCLQYHIKRCTAPCVGYVRAEEYATQVAEARDFLAGDSRKVIDRFSKSMQQASDNRDYEEAAKYRDRVRALAHIQLKQDVNVQGLGDADVFALARDKTGVCVQVFFFRAGQNFGNKSYFPRAAEDDSDEAILAAFLPQFYGSRPPPKTILLSHDVAEAALIETGLVEMHKLKYGVSITAPQRGDKRRIIDFVLKNTEAALVRHAIERAGDEAGLARVCEIFGFEEPPQRIEVFDNSHVQGTNKVGAMVVAGPEGFRKNAYRKFNIKDVDGGDDFAMMREVMTRRFTRALEEGHQGDPDKWPDLLLIDGGVGQLNAVLEVLDGLGVAGDVEVVAISKGPDRNAGREWFHRRGFEPFQLPIDDVGLMYMQRLRDEVHRFAIGTHRAKRGKAMIASSLDDIVGIGPTRKKALLAHFGSGKAVERAGMADLLAVPGISQAVAKIIYDHFHGS
ncbi:MAG: excinuclease ABC subunit UvrC [Proteobacteria bacterium]|nr:excinuclease ABC subunit UvrC [Pseudomonadota bacterium]